MSKGKAVYKSSDHETDDGLEDVYIKINGHVFIKMPQEGYKAIGLTYQQAKEFSQHLRDLIGTIAQTYADFESLRPALAELDRVRGVK